MEEKFEKFVHLFAYPFDQTLIPQGLSGINRLTTCYKLKKHNPKREYI